jgi:hypothetical protein
VARRWGRQPRPGWPWNDPNASSEERGGRWRKGKGKGQSQPEGPAGSAQEPGRPVAPESAAAASGGRRAARAQRRAAARQAKVEAGEAARRAKAEAAARRAQEAAEAKAKAEQEARVRAEAEAERRAQQEAEARARAEAEAKARAEAEAERRAQQEAEAKARAEAEAERRAQQEAEAKARAEERARAKAEARRAKVQAREAARRAKAEAAARRAQEAAEAKAKAEQEARVRAEAAAGAADAISVGAGVLEGRRGRWWGRRQAKAPAGVEGGEPPRAAAATKGSAAKKSIWPWLSARETSPAQAGQGQAPPERAPAPAKISDVTPAERAARRRRILRRDADTADGRPARETFETVGPQTPKPEGGTTPEPPTERTGAPGALGEPPAVEALGAGAAVGAAAGVAAVEDAGDAEGAEVPNRWGRWLGSKQVAAVVLLLLAAEIGYVVHLNTSSSSNNSAAPPTQSILGAPSTTVPGTGTATTNPPQVPVTTVPPTTITTTPPVTAPAPIPATAAASESAVPPQPCTPGDLDIVTTTDRSSYAVGESVTMTTTVTDVTSCVFQPAAVGEYDCPSSLVVVQAGSSSQVYPGAGGEQCNPPPGQTMNPGSIERLTAVWPAATAGTFQAVGTWGWQAGSGQPPNEVNVGSSDFTVS